MRANVTSITLLLMCHKAYGFPNWVQKEHESVTHAVFALNMACLCLNQPDLLSSLMGLSVVTFYVILCSLLRLYLLSNLEYWFNKCLNISVKVISAYNLILPYQVVLVQRKCEANRVANDVWSMLLEYIKIYVTETIKVLYLLSDGCPKQNRNHRFLHSLTNYGRFDEIILYFPQPGHSFLPNDRSFGELDFCNWLAEDSTTG